ncbi:MAG: OmpH family outer membrane protein [Nitrospinae bacterium]|nr:OmpH family outer membrane protein [Nitrospinota bacterium]
MEKKEKGLYGLVTAIFLMFAASLMAAPGAKAETKAVKVGGVNIQTVLDNSEAGKKALTELKAKAEKERGILEKKLDSIKKLEKDIESQRMVAKPEAINEKEQELKNLKRELDAYREDTQQNFQKIQAQTMRKIVNDISRIIKDYGKKNGYTLIMEKGEGSQVVGGFVLYMDEAVDLTESIVKIYDEETRAGGKK